MPHAKQASKRKRHGKTLPVLGAAGLSLSFVGGASAAVDAAAPAQSVRNPAVCRQVTLVEEEVSDVSLATFFVFDKDNAFTMQPRRRMAMGGSCGAGCGCGCACGAWGCAWTGASYTGQMFSSGYTTTPAPRHSPAHKRAHQSKNP
jgi:hypothetical protein